MYDTSSELYNELLRTYFEEYYCYLSVAERKTVDHKYRPKKLYLEAYNCKLWFENEECTVKKNQLMKKSL